MTLQEQPPVLAEQSHYSFHQFPSLASLLLLLSVACHSRTSGMS